MFRIMRYINVTLCLTLAMLTWIFIVKIRSLAPHKSTREIRTFQHFTEALEASVAPDRTVILMQMDSGYAEMAYNFYAASILRHQINNCLVLSLDLKGCALMADAFPNDDVKCFVYAEHPNSTEASVFGSSSLTDKLHLKKQYILDALELGLTVLFSDADIVFQKNPWPDLLETCSQISCDMAVQWDMKHKKYISGFMFAKPMPATLIAFKTMVDYDNTKAGGEQRQLNLAINSLKSDTRRNDSIRVIPLSYSKYPVGKPFFPNRKCPHTSHDYHDAVIIHNNYLKEMHNKIFRFRECHLWFHDGRGQYYSSSSRKYLTYENTVEGGSEHQGLLNAFSIAKLLNRTVILPKHFYREDGIKGNLMVRVYKSPGIYYIRQFTSATHGNYRESSFLDHPLVPEEVKHSQSPTFHIRTSQKQAKVNSSGIGLRLTPMDDTAGPTQTEILQWFQDVHSRVLRLDSLYGYFELLHYESLLGKSLVSIINLI